MPAIALEQTVNEMLGVAVASDLSGNQGDSLGKFFSVAMGCHGRGKLVRAAQGAQ
jgi:hypothetical protein